MSKYNSSSTHCNKLTYFFLLLLLTYLRAAAKIIYLKYGRSAYSCENIEVNLRIIAQTV